MAAEHVFLKTQTVALRGIPFAFGQGEQGVTKAPDALRAAGLKELVEQYGWTLEDLGDMKFDLTEGPPAPKSLNIKNPMPVGKGCRAIYEQTQDLARQSKFVLNVGGDHGLAGGTVPGMLEQYPDLVVVWVDAHADCNTPTSSPSGNYHGMPVAHFLGWFGHDGTFPTFDWDKTYKPLAEENMVMIGLRDVDAGERDLLAKSKIHRFSMQDVDKKGIGKIVKLALSKIDPKGVRPIHLSFDIDGCDPSIAPGTGTIARGGLTYRESHFIVEALHSTGRLVSMDLVEINTDLDQEEEVVHGDRIKIKSLKTVRLGVELIGSALGTSIL